MVSTHLAFRLLLALSAMSATRAYYDDEDMLAVREYYDEVEGISSRELGLAYTARDYDDTPSYYTRGYADGDDFVLSRRALASLGVRADDISHVLVLRAPPPGKGRSPSPASKAEYEKQLKKHEDELKKAKAKLKDAKAKKAAATNDKDKKFWGKEEASARDMVNYENEEIAEYKKLLKK
ncbi:unnamed protein product [Cyclocybe aegerita]|uniref:Uncharacterized protein n=1 Tax=Cyclocybe aegerita TaxID=1973307 RepID=A0A8S0XRR9_CYCAE|nr:unnamed protein product [Cyclocybe aegerita]